MTAIREMKRDDALRRDEGTVNYGVAFGERLSVFHHDSITGRSINVLEFFLSKPGDFVGVRG